MTVLGDAERAALVAGLLVAEVDPALVATLGARVVQLPVVGEAARAPAAEGRELRREDVSGQPRVRAARGRRGAVGLADVVPVGRARLDEVGAFLHLERPRVDLELGDECASLSVGAHDSGRRWELVVHVQDEVVAVGAARTQSVGNPDHLEAVARRSRVADGQQRLRVNALGRWEHVGIRGRARTFAGTGSRRGMGTGRDREDQDGRKSERSSGCRGQQPWSTNASQMNLLVSRRLARRVGRLANSGPRARGAQSGGKDVG